MKTMPIIEVTQHVGEKVTLRGWLATKRDHGKISFFDLRDRSGIVQAVGVKILSGVKTESVIEVVGQVNERPERMINPSLPTGKVEISVESVTVLNAAADLPIPIEGDGYEIDEELRLKYRYLDLRRERMRRNLQLRSDYSFEVRSFLRDQGFTEVETPILTKSTKEGSRDFLVPSRLQPGKFYALPQSPQQYKQLLMTAGVEKYYQFAKCVRDEDLRADRGFEHTQVDIEMSFVEREDVMKLAEDFVTHSMEKMGGVILKKPFPVFTYAEVMAKFGADKFDMRTQAEKDAGVLAFAWVVDFPFFKKVDKDDKAEVADGKSGWTFTHNPFSAPKNEFLADHLAGKNVEQILTSQYDLVCNGFEVGGGSIRAHDPEVLKATFKIMGYNDQEIEASVGHMLAALSIGTPPHGGIALGVERQIMVLAKEKSLKEVVPFPMTSSGKCAVMDAPATVAKEQLNELGLKITV